MKRMIIKAIPDRYLAFLRNPITGLYDGQSVHQIMTHMKRTVATLTDDKLQEEHDRITATSKSMLLYDVVALGL